MEICVFYTSPKLGDIILQLPFVKAIAKHYNVNVTPVSYTHLTLPTICSV